MKIEPDTKTPTGVQHIAVPVKIESSANAWDNWRTRAAKNKRLRTLASTYMYCAKASKALPATITLTRVGPRKLDDDNLASAFKAFRDGIADYFGVDDGSDLYAWRYDQRPAIHKEAKYQVVVTIERRPATAAGGLA